MARRKPVPKIEITERIATPSRARVPLKQPAVTNPYGAKYHALLFAEKITRDFPPQFFVTLTMRVETSRRQAERLLVKWVHEIEKIVLGRRHYHRCEGLKGFAVHERNRVEGRRHLHVLLGDIPKHEISPGLRATMLSIWWEIAGRASVDYFEPGRGGEYYAVKYVETMDDMFPISPDSSQREVPPIEFLDPELGLECARKVARTREDFVRICPLVESHLDLYRGKLWTVLMPSIELYIGARPTKLAPDRQ